MEAVATFIEDLLVSLKGDGEGTPTALARDAAGVSFGPDSWLAARYLGKASNEVASAVRNYTTQLIQNLEQAAASIRGAIEHHRAAEQANIRSYTNIQSSLGGQSGSTQSGSY
ncbi:MAG TPA: hypothetical protein VLJ59_01780 [Mycobacteriales bacterium]|nr:hypothetical protein [Mycobacteriales bacterium]